MSDGKKVAPETKTKSGKGKKMVLIAVAGVGLLGAGVGVGVVAFGGQSEEREDHSNRPKLVEKSSEPKSSAVEGEPGKEAPLKEGTISVASDSEKFDKSKYEVTYYPIEQSFTANLADGSGFVQIGLSIGTYFDGKVITNIKSHMVPIRSAVLMVLSEQDGSVLATSQGKQMLQQRLTTAINIVLREHEGFGGVDNVYFTNLVIQ